MMRPGVVVADLDKQLVIDTAYVTGNGGFRVSLRDDVGHLWTLPSGAIVATDALDSDDAGFDGVAQVVVRSEFSRPVEVELLSGAQVVGTLDLSVLILAKLDIRTGQNLAGLVLPTQSEPCAVLINDGTDGLSWDFSPLDGIAGTFDFYSTEYISLTLPDDVQAAVSYLRIGGNITGTSITDTVLDLSGFKQLTGEIRINTLLSVQSILWHPQTSAQTFLSIASATAARMALNGTLDLRTHLPNLSTYLKVSKTNVGSIVLPQQEFATIDLQDNKLTSIDWTGSSVGVNGVINLQNNLLTTVVVDDIPHADGVDFKINNNPNAVVTGPTTLRNYSAYYLTSTNTSTPDVSNVNATDLRLHGISVTGCTYAAGGNVCTTFYMGNSSPASTHIPVPGVDVIATNMYLRSGGYTQAQVDTFLSSLLSNIGSMPAGAKLLHLGNEGTGTDNAAPSASSDATILDLVSNHGYTITVVDRNNPPNNITYT